MPNDSHVLYIGLYGMGMYHMTPMCYIILIDIDMVKLLTVETVS